jgi:hypothetical protein
VRSKQIKGEKEEGKKGQKNKTKTKKKIRKKIEDKEKDEEDGEEEGKLINRKRIKHKKDTEVKKRNK